MLLLPSSCLVKVSKPTNWASLPQSLDQLWKAQHPTTQNEDTWRAVSCDRHLAWCSLKSVMDFRWHLSPPTSDSLNGGFPDLKTCFPCLLPPLKLLNEDLSKALSEWAVLLRSVYSDHQKHDQMVKQESSHAFSSTCSRCLVLRLDTKQTWRKDFWKMIQKAEA